MNKIGIIKRIWGFCGPFRKHFLYLVSLILIQQIISAIFPIFMGKAVTAVTNNDIETLKFIIIAWVAVALSRPILGCIRERVDLTTFDYEFSRQLSKLSMEKFYNISIGQHSFGHSIIKRSVVNKGQAGVTGLVNMAIYELIPIFLSIAIPLVLLLINIPIVGVVVTVVMCIFTVYTVRYNKKSIPCIRDLDTLDNKIGKHQGEFVDNVNIVLVSAKEKFARTEIDNGNAKKADRGIRVWLPYVNWFYGGQILLTSANVLCVGLTGYLAYKKVIDTGMFVTGAAWVAGVLGTLTNISHIQRNLAKNIAPIGKYFRFLDYKPNIEMPVQPIPMTHVKGDIEFRNVSFTYRGRDEKDALNDETEDTDGDDETDEQKKSEDKPKAAALKNVSIKLASGMRYAFVGPSGAGKSTMVGLILRAHDPEEGHVLVDGVDIHMLDYRELRRNIGLVPQEVALFDGTIRYNVTFGLNGSKDDVTLAELDQVAKLSRISEFSNKLEKGWETVIGERGMKLSGGQKQRIGIARALIKKPQILIFDEATSSLDTANEAHIRESIIEASKGKTTIIIAHRLATVRDADKIFVFDEGRVVGEGTHDELLTSNQHYQHLVRNQVIMA